MKQTRLTVKGQVTIPKDVRNVLGLKPGDPVAFATEGGKVVVRKGDALPVESFSARLERALQHVELLPLGMSVDDYMAMIREPVPIPNRADLP